MIIDQTVFIFLSTTLNSEYRCTLAKRVKRHAQLSTMSIQTVSESVADDVGASGATRNGDDIATVSAWRTFWWNHSNKVINAGLMFNIIYQLFNFLTKS